MAGCRTPLIAAVSGYALGGGFELALVAMATEDRVEGMQAFVEQRRPQFRGR